VACDLSPSAGAEDDDELAAFDVEVDTAQGRHAFHAQQISRQPDHGDSKTSDGQTAATPSACCLPACRDVQVLCRL
jgi:hypothetical protein